MVELLDNMHACFQVSGHVLTKSDSIKNKTSFLVLTDE